MINLDSRTLACIVLTILAAVALTCSAEREQKIEKRIELPDSAGVSVFELLNAYHDVEYKESSSGVFVTSIDSIPSTSSVFWLYYVNDSAGTVACDRHMLEGGEKVEWRLVRGF
jgi:hypothetical protein